MSAPKHTPGKWKNHGRQPNYPGLPHSAVAADTLLARVYSKHYGDEAEEKANADLIASAPDLLAAAQAAWNCISELPPTQARVEVAQMLQAAIAAATGEEA